MDVKGPEGYIEYDGEGKINIADENLVIKKISLVAGGTGITPIYQVRHNVPGFGDATITLRISPAAHPPHPS